MSNVKIVLANKTNKQALVEWEEFLESIRSSTPVDINETEEQKSKRKKRLEKQGNEEEWIKYYFPNYCFAEPANFHIESSKKVFKAKRLYQRRAWARGLSKSTRRMFEVFYKMFVQKFRINALLISKSEDNAIRLLGPYRANLQANQRIIHDYGIQERPGKWSEEEFITRGKCSFRAVGIAQNPRGAKMEEMRVNVLIFDDADDDEVCRNIDRLNQNWQWIERAAIPTVDISKDYFIFFDNNIIAEDSIAVRAAAYADDVELINIRDDDGKSVWPQKNSEADIDDILSKISYESGQAEYFNDGTPVGQVFKEMKWGKCPSLKSLPLVIVYADPSPSNKDRPSLRSKAKNSCKAVGVLGYINETLYVYKAFVDITTNSTFVDWLYAARSFVGNTTQLYTFIENNGLQDPFYEQVLLPLISEKGKEIKDTLSVTPDTRDKPDKYFRIEGSLEPLNRVGRLVLNIEEKDDPGMKRLEGQFKKVSPNSKTMDGPDMVEGGLFILKQKISSISIDNIKFHKRNRSTSKSF